MDSESLYLNKLEFSQKDWRSPIAPFIKNVRLVMLLILTLVVAGVFSFFALPRELNPEVNIPIVLIQTTLPGANPLDVEELVTKPIEQEIANLEGLDRYTSSSSQSISTVSLEFISTADPDQVLQDTKEVLDRVSDLPEDASEPRATKLDFNEQPVWRVALVSELDPISMAKIGDQLQELLEDSNQIKEVNISGKEEEEVVIELQSEAVQLYGLTPDSIAQVIRSNDSVFPAGTIQVQDLEYQLTINDQIASLEQLRQLPISVGQNSVKLGEVASIYFKAKDSSSFVYYSDEDQQQDQAIELAILKSDQATIPGAVDAADQIISEYLQAYPNVEVVSVVNLADDIEEQFSDLGNNYLSTILLVFSTLLLFLGVRQASIASLSIPLTFLSAFVIMFVTGTTLNFLSLFSLLLALGLVVDDAIVIVQAAYRYGQKFTPVQTGLLVFKDFVVPIWSTTLTTVWAFLPLLLATGIIGEFIKTIPIVVSATLISSTTIAVLINIPLTVFFAKFELPPRVRWSLAVLGILGVTATIANVLQGSSLLPIVMVVWLIFLILSWWSRRQLAEATQRASKKIGAVSAKVTPNNIIDDGLINFDPINARYKQLLSLILSTRWRRYIVYAVSVGLFVLGIGFVVSGLTRAEFFPATDQNELYVDIEGPAGWTVERTLEASFAIQDRLLAQPEIESLTLRTGSSSPVSEGGSGANWANYTVVLKPEAERARSSVQLADDLRQELSLVPAATYRVIEASGGPPAGSDLQVNITGSELETLETIANDFAEQINTIEGAQNVQISLTQSAGQLSVELDQVALTNNGLSAVQIGSWLRTAVTGTDTGTITIDDQDYDITLTLAEELQSIGFLQSLTLPTPTGQNYTLASVADLALETSPASIERQDGTRVVRVTAAASGISAPELLAAFESKVAEYDLPAGYAWTVGGVNEENQESTNSIFQAMGVSLLLILITMVLQLGSFRKASLVLVVIPLAVAGVLINFTIFRIPLSFPALIGVLALFGIVVNNSIMLIEKINQNLHFGLGFVDGIVDACTSRVEAIFFTSLTTTIGLLPITISDPLWRGLGGAIIAGLSVSGLIILFLLPALYVEIFENTDELAQKSKST